MSKFSKGKKRKDPAISTAALPDIVFMLLFFFMVTTKPRKEESFVILKQTKLEAVTKLAKDDKKVYYYFGYDARKPSKKQHVLFIDDVPIYNYQFVGQYLEQLRSKDEYGQKWDELRNVMKIDQNAPVGELQEIQEYLRDNEAYNVNYSTKQK